MSATSENHSPSINSRSVQDLRIARIYAQALWNIANKEDKVGEVVEEYQALVRDVLDKDPDLERFFGLVSISQGQRARLLERVFKGRISELLYNFLSTLNAHDRLGLVRAALVAFQAIQAEEEGRIPVTVKTAVRLDDAGRRAVLEMLRERMRIKPELTEEVDPDVLGGVWLRVGDTVYDRTVRTGLGQLRDNILARRTYEIQGG